MEVLNSARMHGSSMRWMQSDPHDVPNMLSARSNASLRVPSCWLVIQKGQLVSSYSVDTGACSNVFKTVDSDCESADTERRSLDRTVDSLIQEAKSPELRTALTALRDTTIVPTMESIVEHVSGATYHGSQAVGHVVSGDREMRDRSSTAASTVMRPDMPGIL